MIYNGKLIMEDMVDSFRGFSNKGFNTMVKILEKHQ